MFFGRSVIWQVLWGFSLQHTLQHLKAQADGAGVFSGLSIGLTQLVFDCESKIPPQEELRRIVETGGGKFIPSLDLSTSKAPSKRQRDGASAETVTAGLPLIIISSVGALATTGKKEKNSLLSLAKTGGPGIGIYDVEFLFLAILRQRIDYQNNLILS